MPNRLVHLLVLAVALSVTGVAVVTFATPHVVAQPTLARIAAGAPLDVVLLPTVVVRPEPDVVTLGTVTVRPSDEDRALARGLGSDDFARVALVTHIHGGSPALISAGFDMPYYSFGKSLRRVNKE